MLHLGVSLLWLPAVSSTLPEGQTLPVKISHFTEPALNMI